VFAQPSHTDKRTTISRDVDSVSTGLSHLRVTISREVDTVVSLLAFSTIICNRGYFGYPMDSGSHADEYRHCQFLCKATTVRSLFRKKCCSSLLPMQIRNNVFLPTSAGRQVCMRSNFTLSIEITYDRERRLTGEGPCPIEMTPED
jgi:hypothetical protein